MKVTPKRSLKPVKAQARSKSDGEDDEPQSQLPEDWALKAGTGLQTDLLSHRGRFNRPPIQRTAWRPPTSVRAAREKAIEAGRKPRTYAQYFREYRAYADCVLDYLRTQGCNARFVVRVATDRHWVTDVRDQKFWLDDMDAKFRCNHYMYRGEAAFYGVIQDGEWRFGLKDLQTVLSKTGVIHRFPLEGQDYFYHKRNCQQVAQSTLTTTK